jgi:hypothetical protein
MGSRGPKAVEVVLLKRYAEVWAGLFHLLRDGQPGQLVRLKPGKRSPTVFAKVLLADQEKTPNGLEGLRQLEKLRGKQGIIWLLRPVFPERETWEQLKDSVSIAEVQKTLANIEKYIRKRWRYSFYNSNDKHEPLTRRRPAWTKTIWSQLLRATRENAEEIPKARGLPHYPRADRPSSDDKRIEFFAKVFAGFALRLAPLTATKRLSSWSPLKNESSPPSLLTQDPNCPHCGIGKLKGFPAGTIVRCPGCNKRYYVAANWHMKSRR